MWKSNIISSVIKISAFCTGMFTLVSFESLKAHILLGQLENFGDSFASFSNNTAFCYFWKLLAKMQCVM